MHRIHARVLELLKKYGHETISFQVLEPGLCYWFDGDACVAYADTGGSWVTVGAPIAAPQRVVEVMQRFAEAARAARRRPRFFGIEQDVSKVSSFGVLQVGEQPVWDPKRWPQALRAKRSLREQMRRARANGVTVRLVDAQELIDPDSVLRRAIDRMIARWVDALAMAPMGFVVSLDMYNFPDERRFLIAEHEGSVVGILIAVPIYGRGGWFLEDVLRDPNAPNGTVESMFHHAMRLLAAQGSRHVTYGLAPLAGAPRAWLRRIRCCSRWLYDFDGLRAFKAKLCPTSWHPVYLAYPAHERGVRALIDVLAAFGGGSLARFAWKTLIHRAGLVTRWLAVLLAPSIIVLASASGPRGFASRGVQVGWASLALALCLALWRLSLHWSRSLAVASAAAALVGGVAGCLWLLFDDAGRLAGSALWAMGPAVAVLWFAAVFLWSARNRAHLYGQGLAVAPVRRDISRSAGGGYGFD